MNYLSFTPIFQLDKSNCIFDPDPFKTIFTCNLASREEASKEFLSSTTLHPPPAKIKFDKSRFSEK
jgi:hypothetical protein